MFYGLLNNSQRKTLCYVMLCNSFVKIYLRVINDRLQQFFVFKPKLLSACDSVKLTGKLAARRDVTKARERYIVPACVRRSDDKQRQILGRSHGAGARDHSGFCRLV